MYLFGFLFSIFLFYIFNVINIKIPFLPDIEDNDVEEWIEKLLELIKLGYITEDMFFYILLLVIGVGAYLIVRILRSSRRIRVNIVPLTVSTNDPSRVFLIFIDTLDPDKVTLRVFLSFLDTSDLSLVRIRYRGQ